MARLKEIDIAKGIGIIFIVYGHTSTPLHDGIFLFHVPLFFFISGFLFPTAPTHSIYKFILNKALTLLIPYIFFLVSTNLFFKLLCLFTGTSFVLFPSMLIRPYGVAGPLWFLISLFTITVIFKVIDNYGPKMQSKIMASICLFIGGSVLSYYEIRLPFYLDTSMTAISFFTLGFIYYHYKYIKWILFLVSIPIFFFFTTKAQMPKVDLIENIYEPWFTFPITTSIIFIIMDISKHLTHSRAASLLSLIGRQSLIILALHLLTLEYLFVIFPRNHYGYSVIITIIAIGIIILTNKYLKIDYFLHRISHVCLKLNLNITNRCRFNQ